MARLDARINDVYWISNYINFSPATQELFKNLATNSVLCWMKFPKYWVLYCMNCMRMANIEIDNTAKAPRSFCGIEGLSYILGILMY